MVVRNLATSVTQFKVNLQNRSFAIFTWEQQHFTSYTFIGVMANDEKNRNKFIKIVYKFCYIKKNEINAVDFLSHMKWLKRLSLTKPLRAHLIT